jgi:2-polyprenyl-3-methyl-5-hydroxy-6-metoxy-1,4-benzoquinol methylase
MSSMPRSAGSSRASASFTPYIGAPACRCCGSANVVLRGKKRGQFIPREFDFNLCQDCGFMAVDPFSGFEIYNDAYYRGAGPDPYVDYESEYHNWRRSDRMLEFDDLVRIAEHAHAPSLDVPRGKSNPPHELRSPALSIPSERPPVRWLDFGCGAGGFLKYLRERGSLAGRALDLTGHDVGSYAELLKHRDRFRILNLSELQCEPIAAYDVISMIEVIEHLPSPLEPMQLVARLLKPGGLLLLTTGNMESPIARRQGIHYRYCAPEIHVSLFNPRCLGELYRRVGLTPLAVRYRGAVKFKVVKSLRHRRVLRAMANAALTFPPFVRAVDALYGVSAMPCAVKARPATPQPAGDAR